MKTMYERLRALGNVYSDKFPQGISFVLIVFFILFGTASLVMLLLNTPG
jgi:hypothetical protein